MNLHAPIGIEPEALDDLQHDWVVVAEYDGGYSLRRCRACGTELVS